MLTWPEKLAELGSHGLERLLVWPLGHDEHAFRRRDAAPAQASASRRRQCRLVIPVMPPPTLRMVSSGTASPKKTIGASGNSSPRWSSTNRKPASVIAMTRSIRAALILPANVVLESQRRLLPGEEIGLQVLGEIVNRHVGARRQRLPDARIQDWIGRETLGARMDRSARFGATRPVPRRSRSQCRRTQRRREREHDARAHSDLHLRTTAARPAESGATSPLRPWAGASS